ncbi:hypothetical protein M4F09_004853 [Salmonella enterica]|nr:hypothetical protein [Salmonella enterica]
MQEIIRSRATYNLHYGVRPRVSVWCNGKKGYYGQKGASGEKVVVPEVQQVKPVVTHGKHREKRASSQECTSDRVVIDNNLLGKALVEGCAIAAPCRTKVAEQLLEIGVKTGITGIVAKEIADKISAEELDHLITLKMTGNDDITSKYLGLLEGKYGPSNTGGDQIADIGPTNTGGKQTATGNVPTHTGNNQVSDQGATNTGNTEGVPDTGGNTTVTPIPDGPNKDDLAYLNKPANLSPEGSARSGAFNEAKRQSGIPVSQSPSKVYPNVDKRNNPQPGYIYEFDVPRPGGGTQKVYIRDDAGGHFFTDDPSQNRGPHFNDEKGNHYDY